MLALIWQASLALALLSLLIVLVLVIRRIFEDEVARQHTARYAELSRALLAVVDSQVELSALTLPELALNDRPIAMKVALDLLRMVEGQGAERIVQALQVWNMQPFLKSLLEKGRRGQRIQAATLLARFDDRESLLLLRNRAGDADPYLQLAVLRGLAARGAQEFLHEILEGLAHSRQRNTMMLADILKRFGEPAVAELGMLAAGSAPLEVRLAAIAAMADIGSLQAVEPLLTLGADKSADIRAKALSALAVLGDIRAGPAVLRGLQEENTAVRVQATRAAGALGLQESLPRLMELLADPTWWVRYRAAEAVLRVGAERLLRARAENNDEAGRMARMVLAEKGALDG